MCQWGSGDAGGGLTLTPGPTHKPETDEGQGGPRRGLAEGPGPPRRLPTWEQIKCAHSWGQSPRRHAQRCRLPRRPDAAAPRPPSEVLLSPHRKLSLKSMSSPPRRPMTKAGEQRRLGSLGLGDRRGLEGTSPSSGEQSSKAPVGGVPTRTEGSFLLFSELAFGNWGVGWPGPGNSVHPVPKGRGSSWPLGFDGISGARTPAGGGLGAGCSAASVGCTPGPGQPR